MSLEPGGRDARARAPRGASFPCLFDQQIPVVGYPGARPEGPRAQVAPWRLGMQSGAPSINPPIRHVESQAPSLSVPQSTLRKDGGSNQMRKRTPAVILCLILLAVSSSA